MKRLLCSAGMIVTLGMATGLNAAEPPAKAEKKAKPAAVKKTPDAKTGAPKAPAARPAGEKKTPAAKPAAKPAGKEISLAQAIAIAEKAGKGKAIGATRRETLR